jgi:predicted  nucleic acid-binding Zn-ribbon protein
MLKCSNCGQKAEITKDWACRWCGYPLISRAYNKEKAKQEAIEAKEKAKQEAIEAKRAREAEERAKKEAEQAAKEKARQEAIEAKEKAKQEAIEAKRAREAEERAKKEAEIVSGIYEGDVQLVIPSLVDSNQLRQFQEDLKSVDDLKILLSGWSEKDTIIVVSLHKPMTLIRSLSHMRTVGKVDKKGEQIVVTLRNHNVS